MANNLILYVAGPITLTGRHPSTGEDMVLTAPDVNVGQTFKTKATIAGREVVRISFADVRRAPADPRTMIQCEGPDGEIFSHVVANDLVVPLRGDLFALAKELSITIPRRERRTA